MPKLSMKSPCRRKLRFTLLEICITITILISLISSTSYYGYSTLTHYRKKHGLQSFVNYLTILHHANCIKEKSIILKIKNNSQYLETTLMGNSYGFPIKNSKKRFFTGRILDPYTNYEINIQNNILPNKKNLIHWIQKNNSAVL